MPTKAEIQKRLSDYLDSYLRAESSITALKFRTGSLVTQLQKTVDELEKHKEYDVSELVKESLDLIGHTDRGAYGSFRDVYSLVRSAILDRSDDVTHYANRLKERFAKEYEGS